MKLFNSKSYVLGLLFCSVLAFNSPSFATGGGLLPGMSGASIAPMLSKVMPAVVNIHAEGDSKSTVQPFSQPDASQPANNANRHFLSIGSGVIVDVTHGYIITNAHVVYDSDNLTVTLNDGRRYKGHIVGLDTNFDIAVIQINASNLTAIPLGDSAALRVGDFVTTVGSPFNLKQTVTSGIVSALHRSVHIEGYEDFIQIDAPINEGSSGGALINASGQLIGINTAILAPEGGNIGIGFAIPINLVKGVKDQLIKYGQLQRGLVGILLQDLTPDLAGGIGSPAAQGALVSQVTPNSPGQKAGIKVGDIITSVNNEKATTASEVRNNVGLLHPGSAVTLGVIRDDKPLTIKVTVISEKDYKDRVDASNNSVLTGVTFDNFDQQTLDYGRVKGVQVTFVDQNSDAWSADLRPGNVITSVNQQTITNLDELEQILQQHPRRLLLRVIRDDGPMFIVIP